jgi:transcriptional regulator with XRE-family HTH domain
MSYSGPELKSLRKRSRLTQMQVVAMTGVCEATIVSAENGSRVPHDATREKLLKLYRKRIQYWNRLDKVLQESI